VISDRTQFVSKYTIKLNGTELALQFAQKLLSVTVDQHAHLPDMFELHLNDPDLAILDQGLIELLTEVTIEAATVTGEKVSLIKGEVTALEPVYREGMIGELIVRGYDKSHRLFRQPVSKSHLNKKDSDLAEEIAQAAGLKTDVEPTSTVYDHIFQHNQSDLAFLLQRAWRIGYECYLIDDTLYFHKPRIGTEEMVLNWGKDLLSFQPRMTVAEQVKEVMVRGWDVEKKEPIIGRADQGDLTPRVDIVTDRSVWDQARGEKQILIDQNVITQAEADILAKARLDEISGAFITADGVAYRRPDIKAGRVLKIEGPVERFSGSYLVTQAVHRYTTEGLITEFSVTGSRMGLISDYLSVHQTHNLWPGVVVAIVTNTDDPQNWGRVKVEFPWMSEQVESCWARVMGIGAGAESGMYVIPEVGDEVLISFYQGDFDRPYVLGGLWNGQNSIPPKAGNAPSGEKPLVRTWHSRTGHSITIFDNSDNKIEILTAGGQCLVLDDAAKKITITGKGDLSIEVKANLSIHVSGNMDLQADGNVTIKGAQINLN